MSAALVMFLLMPCEDAFESAKSMRDLRQDTKTQAGKVVSRLVSHDAKTGASKGVPVHKTALDENAMLRDLKKIHEKALLKQIRKGEAMVQEAKSELFTEVQDEADLANKAQKRGNVHEFKDALIQVSKLSMELQSLVGNESRLERAAEHVKNGVVNLKTIPKIVHHMYKVDLAAKASNGKAVWPNKIWEVSYKGWMRHFPEPEYEHIFWPDENVTAFFKARCPEHFDLYESKQVAIEKVDISRYCILKELGGIYADLDYEPRQNFFKDLSPSAVNLVQSPYISETVQNSLMASPAHHPYWQIVLDTAQKHQAGSVLQVSGPQLLDSLMETHIETGSHGVHVLPCNQFQRATKFRAQETLSSLAKGCRVLAPSDFEDKTLKGIHWGTVSWQGGSGQEIDDSSQKMFDWFHHMEASSLAEVR